jgi:nitrilase
MNIAAIQLSATADIPRNLQQAVEKVCIAVDNGVDLVVLPEVFQFRGKLTPDVKTHLFEPIPGPTTQIFQKLAHKHHIHIVLGSIYEQRANDDIRCFNTQVVIDRMGEIQTTYRKRNLFRSNVGKQALDESRSFVSGTEAQVFEADGFRFGCSICYDLRFPSVYRDNFRLGADVMLVPSAFTRQTGQAHWKVLLRARAIENLSYVIAPNQFGEDERGVQCYGHSLMIDPWGEVLEEANECECSIISTHVDLERLKAVRYLLPIR